MNQIEIRKRQMEAVSCVLEMMTLLVLGNILGDNGIVYLAVALECLSFFWTVTGSRVADVLGRLLRGRSSKGQYRNANMLRKNVLFLEGFIGLIGGVILFIFAGFLGDRFFGVSYSVAMIWILAPVVLLRTFVSVLLGYFQGEGTELPSVISYVMRQLCILFFSLVFAGLFDKRGQLVSALLRQENFTAMYGGMGVALGILIAEALVFLFLFLVYRGSRKKERKSGGEGMRITDTFGSQAGALYGTMLPLIFTALLQQLPIWLGLFFFRRNVADVAAMNDYGVLYGKYIPLVGILLFPACALLLESAYKVAGCVRRDEQRFAKGNLSGGLHMAVIYGMFFSVFMAIFASQIADVFCSTRVGQATQMIRSGSFVILFAILGFYFSEILLLLGGRMQVLGALAFYNLVYVIGLLLFLRGGNAGVMALIYAGLIAGAVFVGITGALLFYQTRLGVDWLQGGVIPAGAACVTGLLLLFVGKAVTPHLGSLAAILVCLLLGQICYWLVLLLIRNFREQELGYIPGGKLIRILGQLLRVF